MAFIIIIFVNCSLYSLEWILSSVIQSKHSWKFFFFFLSPYSLCTCGSGIFSVELNSAILTGCGLSSRGLDVLCVRVHVVPGLDRNWQYAMLWRPAGPGAQSPGVFPWITQWTSANRETAEEKKAWQIDNA